MLKLSNKYILLAPLGALIIAGAFYAWVYWPQNVSVKFAQPASEVSLISERFKLGEVKNDITYCGQQKLDLYEPRNRVFSRQPLVIYIHGGSWKSNNKTGDAKQREMIDGLRDKGFAIASIDYRLTPKYSYPEPQQDALCAVRFLRANSVKYSLDPDKFAVVGFSAGANFAALVGVVDSKSEMNNGQYKNVSSRVKAVVGISGVYDFQRDLRPNSIANIRNLMRGAKPDAGAPVTYITSDDPPFLLIHGDKDTTVPLAQSVVFSKNLTNAGVQSNLIVVKNANHILLPDGGDLSPSTQSLSQSIQGYILSHLIL